jgi:hypothetical protein
MITVHSFSEAGGHLLNEDAFLVRPHPSHPDGWLVGLADGQGGRAGGAKAAQLACRTVLDVAAALPLRQLADQAAWPGVLRRADEAVSANPEAGFTTLIGLCVLGDQLVGASSGDSAVLAMSDGVAAEMTRLQVKNPSIGSGAAVCVPFGLRLARPWSVLAMSDGVWKYVGWQGVVEATRRDRGQPLMETLQTRARLPGSGRFQDDFTIVALEGAAGDSPC